MGWGRMLLLGDLGQQLDLQDQKQEIESLRRELRSASAGRTNSGVERRVARLEQENDELRLYLAALIRHLTAKRIVDAADPARDRSGRGRRRRAGGRRLRGQHFSEPGGTQYVAVAYLPPATVIDSAARMPPLRELALFRLQPPHKTAPDQKRRPGSGPNGRRGRRLVAEKSPASRPAGQGLGSPA